MSRAHAIAVSRNALERGASYVCINCRHSPLAHDVATSNCLFNPGTHYNPVAISAMLAGWDWVVKYGALDELEDTKP